MDFSLTEGQQDLADLTRSIVTKQITPARLREVEAGPDRFDRALWSELATADILAATLPTEVGGSGFGVLEQCSVLIELGRAVAPVPYLPSIVVAASAIMRFGNSQQQAEWVKPAATGQVVLTAALSEEHEAHPSAPATRAERVDGGWRLTGVKTTVPAGGVADLFLVPAMTPDGVAVFLVTPSDEGVDVERQRIVDSDTEAWLNLVDVRLGDDRLLGETAQGAELVEWLAARTTIGLCATQLGVTERALELTAAYAQNRVQFDRPIGSFQAVTQRLADAYVDVEAIRLTLWQAAWRLSEALPCDTEIATAKFWAADGGHRVAHTAVHVHGGVGIDLDNELHRYFVAAKRNEFSLGSATAQLRRIGAGLAATPVEPA
jgi:3-oxocholest-4-en-26-oyl-CoA dehydrogenase beta subunit